MLSFDIVFRKIRTNEIFKMDDVEVVHIFETDMIETVETCVKAMLSAKQYQRSL